MRKTQKLTLANRIRNIQAGESFDIGGKREREEAGNIIRALRDAGILTVAVGTKEMPPKSGKFKVFAL